MADFDPAFDRTITNEGGYKLTDIAADKGGLTYAGIARKPNPHWAGWRYIDAKDMNNLELSREVRNFYKDEFWDAVGGDDIKDQVIAESIYDFAVNAGVATAVKLAQLVVGSVPDGRIGPRTLDKLNALETSDFVAKYTVAKIARYAEICNRDRSQNAFLLGWINRTIKGLA
jgi:lysozyme family protein